jgi:hypothetical protein
VPTQRWCDLGSDGFEGRHTLGEGRESRLDLDQQIGSEVERPVVGQRLGHFGRSTVRDAVPGEELFGTGVDDRNVW